MTFIPPPIFLMANMHKAAHVMDDVERANAENKRLNAKFEQNVQRVKALHQQADSEHWNGQVFRRVEEEQ